jgi:hypothetical protein
MESLVDHDDFFNLLELTQMSQTELTRMAMALGMLYAVYKFVPHPAAKAAALGVAGTVIAKRTPVLKDYL